MDSWRTNESFMTSKNQSIFSRDGLRHTLVLSCCMYVCMYFELIVVLLELAGNTNVYIKVPKYKLDVLGIQVLGP